MNTRHPDKRKTPRIVLGARALAALSVVWSGYAITDLMHSGLWGITVAVAGDIGWITVLWAEANRVRLWGYRWPATLAGWLIAVGVGVLLAAHGAQGPDGSWAQAMAGVFVIAVSKIVWLFALAADRDPAELTAEQEAEIHSVIRDSEYAARLSRARSLAEIARIRDQASVVIARDEADFEIGLERLEKRAELHRRTPLVLPPNTALPTEPGQVAAVADQPIEVIGEQGEQPPSALANNPNNPGEQIANKASTSPNAAIGQPSLADLVREQIAHHPNNADAIRGVMAARPDANKESVAAAVRRERAKTRSKGGYA